MADPPKEEGKRSLRDFSEVSLGRYALSSTSPEGERLLSSEEHLRQLQQYTKALESLLNQNNIAFDPFEPEAPGKADASERQKRREKRHRRQLITHLGKGARQEVTVRFADLSCSLLARVKPENPTTLWSHFLCTPLGLYFRERQRKAVLQGVSGVIRPGTLTLVLGPPRSGKKSLLRALASIMYTGQGCEVTGKITYNGHTLPNPADPAPPFFPARVAAFISDTDEHLASLTVEETLDFACDLLAGEQEGLLAEISNALDIQAGRSKKVEAMMEVMGLDGRVAETKIGSSTKRGVSGGQLRRVSTCEMLMGLHSVYFGDEVSNGLDSSTTFEMVHAMRMVARRFGCSFVLSLLQCPPEVLDLFDQVIILSHGRAIYNGPRSDAIAHFAQLPLFRDEAAQLEAVNRDMDSSTFLRNVMLRASQPEHLDTLVAHFEQSEHHKAIMSEVQAEHPQVDWMASYTQHFPRNLVYSTLRCAARYRTVVMRDRVFIARIVQCVIVALLVGSLFYDLDKSDFVSRFGVFIFVVMFVGMGGKVQVSLTCKARAVMLRQRRARFYSTPAYIIGQNLGLLPGAVLETVLVCPPLFYMIGLAGGGSGFFIFLFTALLLNLAVSQIMRFLANALPTLKEAVVGSLILLFLFALFSGFPIAEDNIPVGWKWLLAVNPFRYAFRAFALNEFKSSEFDDVNPRCAQVLGPQNCRVGDIYLRAYGMTTDSDHIATDVVALLVISLVMLAMNVLALVYVRARGGNRSARLHKDLAIFEKLADDKHRDEQPPESNAEHSEQHADGGSNNNANNAAAELALPVRPISLSFEDIRFVVPSATNPDLDYQILADAEGFALPGTMTALLGPSGCGKTTLLDLLSGRKTVGYATGEIVLNHERVPNVGGLPSFPTSSGVLGYVEQTNIHSPLTTVRESLLFSARLRLPHHVPDSTKVRVANEMLSLLNLREVANELVGKGALSFEELKKVTIGVELVANPSLLFLDEPTSGLSELGALSVMNILKNISAQSRTLICTIHQPSNEIFSLFDQVLLLGRGGQTYYFGPQDSIVKYFESIPEVPRMHLGSNSASYVLEVISDKHPTMKDLAVNFARYYMNSDIRREQEQRLSNMLLVAGKSTQHLFEGNKLKGEDAAPMARVKTLPAASEGVELPAVVKDQEQSKAGGESDVLMALRRDDAVESDEEIRAPDSLFAAAAHKGASLPLQFRLCLVRTFRSYLRATNYVVARTLAHVLLAFVVVSAYWRQDLRTEADVLSRLSCIFISIHGLSTLNITTPISFMLEEKPVFVRERALGVYGALPFLAAHMLVEIPFVALATVLFTNVFYWGVGLRENDDQYMWFLVMCGMHLLLYTYLGKLLAMLLPSLPLANAVSALLILQAALFTGVLIPPQEIPDYWVFLYRSNPLMYTYEAVVMTQFRRDHTPIQTSNGAVVDANIYVSDTFGGQFYYADRWTNFSALLFMNLFVGLLLYLTLRFKKMVSR